MDTMHNKPGAVKSTMHARHTNHSSTRAEIMAAQLQNGHTSFTHSHLLRTHPAPVCIHGEVHLTVLHILHHWPLYNEERQIIHLFGMLRDILGEDHGYISNVMAFLHDTEVDLSLTDFLLSPICAVLFVIHVLIILLVHVQSVSSGLFNKIFIAL
jgi:hypothetical protein